MIFESGGTTIFLPVLMTSHQNMTEISNGRYIHILEHGQSHSNVQYYKPSRFFPRVTRSYCAIFLSYVLPISQRNIDFIMLHTKKKDFHQILVDGENYNTLHSRYGASRSFNEVITEILQHHEAAVSIIGDCESCKEKFKAAIQK